MKSDANVELRRTYVKRLELFKDRWTTFGATAGIIAISEKLSPSDLRKFDLFQDCDDEFLEQLSPDISVAKWKKGAVLFEEGAYIDLAFYVVRGSVEVSLHSLQQRARRGGRSAVDRSKKGKMRWLFGKGARKSKRKKDAVENKTNIVFLSSMDFNINANGSRCLGAGEIFGEIGAINGWPQSVTARLAADSILLQIRVPALRRMKRKSKSLKQKLDRIYRERSLFSHLQALPLLRDCEVRFIERLTQRVDLVSFDPGEVICTQHEQADALFIVRSGFVKLTQQFGEGEIVVSYLSKGMTLGEIELLVDDSNRWNCTASSVEYTDLIQISREDFNAVIKAYPKIEKQLWDIAVNRVKQFGYSKKNINHSEFIHATFEKGLLEGNSILVIDLNACTRCDDCVRGCADTHGGRPRFVREGDKYENLLITKSCYHCRDPVCLVGCPTGAIRRASVGEVVEIEDDLCIGCKACANNCPYDAIIMHETGEKWPKDMVPEMLRGKDRLLASKCDLCYKTNHEPACVANCPHGCAVRVGSIREFQNLIVNHQS